MQMTIYMLLTSDLRYLVWLEQNDWKHLKRKNKRKNFNKNLLVHFLTIFVEIDLAFRKSDDILSVFEGFNVANFFKENGFFRLFQPKIQTGNFNGKW